MQQDDRAVRATDVLVVGGGYAGLWAALSAARQRAALARELRITLVAPEPRLTARPRLYEANLAPDDARIDFLPALRTLDVGFVPGTVTDVDEHAVHLADGTRIDARAVVLATGSVAAPRDVPGLAEHGEDADTAPAAARLWARVRALRDGARIVVLGGGFTGVELAAELASYARSGGRALQVTIVDRARIAAGYSEEARTAIRGALAGLDVQWREHVDVAAVTRDAVRLANGEVLPCDLPVWATGLVPSALATRVAQRLGATRAVDGRLDVLATLQLPAAPHWFAAGDVAAARAEGGHFTTFSCQHALSLGPTAGHNAVNLLADVPLLDFVPKYPYGTCLDLGAAGAIVTSGFERALRAFGVEAKPHKRFINEQLIVPPVLGDAAALYAIATPNGATVRE